MVFAALAKWQEYYSSSTEVQEGLLIVFSNIVRVVVGLATRFGQASATSAVTVDSEMYRAYGSLIESTVARKDQIFDNMWAASVKSELGSQCKYNLR